MDYRPIWILILWAASIIRPIIPDEEVTEDVLDLTYEFGSNSTYSERQWNISTGFRSDIVNEDHMEDCLQENASRHSEWKSNGPLCEICRVAITKLFPPEEPIKLRYGAFLHGILTFPDTPDEMLIDVVLCSYDPKIGIDRFYLTRGKEKNSAYVVKTNGDKDVYYVKKSKIGVFKYVYALMHLVMSSHPTHSRRGKTQEAARINISARLSKETELSTLHIRR